jgi:hypothetical protein
MEMRELLGMAGLNQMDSGEDVASDAVSRVSTDRGYGIVTGKAIYQPHLQGLAWYFAGEVVVGGGVETTLRRP